ncbi:McrC family protein [Helicobacter sp. NHP21005]|uniref:McrC family protein n=1 Tax=Helicobacter felistomachi TaxID=3040201 RepID=UPI0025748339|nr:nuclease domain-containing protein [Helicobacter sp. NHP21005]BEG57343.1 McrC family protein [Helicobacter sp. NHP21005]
MRTIPTLCRAEYTDFTKEDIRGRLPDPNDDEEAQRIWKTLQNFADPKKNRCFLKFENKDTLRTQNYVGLLQVRGFCLEILPKVHEGDSNAQHDSSCQNSLYAFDNTKFQEQVVEFVEKLQPKKKEEHGEEPEKQKPIAPPPCRICHAKQILYNCLATLRSAPFKKIQSAYLGNANLPLLDIFACMFLEECQQLIKRGLKRDYLRVAKNRTFLKGKLEIAKHLKFNLIHKERFYTTSNEYSLDVPPNRLIKATLKYLKTLALSPKTQDKFNPVWFVFEEISPTLDTEIDSDFAKSEHATRFREYQSLLAWCRLFLRQTFLTPYSGVDQAHAFLFQMERLFESFVGHWLQRSVEGYRVSLQEENREYLMEDEKLKDHSALVPDIVLKNEKEILILDTKWKVEKSKKVEKADLYQMWAYASVYASLEKQREKRRRVSVYLVYPWHGNTQSIMGIFKPRISTGKSDMSIKLETTYFPLVIMS